MEITSEPGAQRVQGESSLLESTSLWCNNKCISFRASLSCARFGRIADTSL